MKKAVKLIGKQEKRKELISGTETESSVVPKVKGRPRKDTLNISAPDISKPQPPPPLDTSLPVVLTDGTTELCRRSSRKKTMKFDIKEVLNIKTTPKILIEARIDTPVSIPPEIPRRISICRQPSSSSNKPKSIIQDFVSISPPPPSILVKKRQVCKTSKKVESTSKKDEAESEGKRPEEVESPIPDQCSDIINDFMELIDEKPKEKESSEFQPKRRSTRLKTMVGGSPYEEKRLLNSSVDIVMCESSNDSSVSDTNKKKNKKSLNSQISTDSNKSDDSNVSPSPVVSECSTEASSENKVEESFPRIITRRKTFKPLKNHCLLDNEPTIQVALSPSDSSSPVNVPIETRLARRRATVFISPSPVNVPALKKRSKTPTITAQIADEYSPNYTPPVNVPAVKKGNKTSTIPAPEKTDEKTSVDAPEVKKRSKTPTVLAAETSTSQTLSPVNVPAVKKGNKTTTIPAAEVLDVKIPSPVDLGVIKNANKSPIASPVAISADKTSSVNVPEVKKSSNTPTVSDAEISSNKTPSLDNVPEVKKRSKTPTSSQAELRKTSKTPTTPAAEISLNKTSSPVLEVKRKSKASTILAAENTDDKTPSPVDVPEVRKKSKPAHQISDESSASSTASKKRGRPKAAEPLKIPDSTFLSPNDEQRTEISKVANNSLEEEVARIFSDNVEEVPISMTKELTPEIKNLLPAKEFVSEQVSSENKLIPENEESVSVEVCNFETPVKRSKTQKESEISKENMQQKSFKENGELEPQSPTVLNKEKSKSHDKSSEKQASSSSKKNKSHEDSHRLSSKSSNDSSRSSSKDTLRSSKDISRPKETSRSSSSSKESPKTSKESRSFHKDSSKSKDSPRSSSKDSSRHTSKDSSKSKESPRSSSKESRQPSSSSKSVSTDTPRSFTKEVQKSSSKSKESPESSKQKDSSRDRKNDSHKSSSKYSKEVSREDLKVDCPKVSKSSREVSRENLKVDCTNISEVRETKIEHDFDSKKNEICEAAKPDLEIVKSEDQKPSTKTIKNDLETSQKMEIFEDFRISENFAKIFREDTPKTGVEALSVKQEEVIIEDVTKSSNESVVTVKAEEDNDNSKVSKSTTDNESKKKASTKKVASKPDLVKKKLKKSLEKGAEYLQKIVESVSNKSKILKRKKNSDTKVIRRRNSLPQLSKADRKLQLKAIRDSLIVEAKNPSAEVDAESAEKFESDSAIKLKNGLLKDLAEDDSSSGDKCNSLLTRSYSTIVSNVDFSDENGVDLLLESFQVKSKKSKEKKEVVKKKKEVKDKEKSSDPLDDIEKFIAISENLLSKPENKENKDILVKKLFNEIKEFEANVKQEILAPPRRSHRLQTISKTVSKSSKGVVRNEKFSTEDYKMDLAELEAENAKFLKDMEERLTQFTVIRKSEYKCERIISKEAERMVCDCYLTPDEEDSGAFGCGDDCLNKLLMIECGDDCVVGERCTNRRFQNFMYSHCKVFRTEKKGFGIMADAVINPGDFIMEYVGEVINTEQFEGRREVYSKDKNAHYYFMALRSDSIIDATTRGNISRFINHSCEPNAETQKWTVNGELRIGFFCVKKIQPGEEITFDYQFQRYGREAQKCFCESENCRGWIGEEPDSEEEDELEEEEEEEEIPEEVPIVVEVVAKEIEKPIEIKEITITPIQEEIVEVLIESKPPEIPLPVPPPPIDEVGEIPKELPQPVPPPSEIPVEDKPKVIATVKPKVPKKIKRRPQVLEDYDIIENVESLIRSGLKNQAQTLKLSRLMVRSKLLLTRIKILQIIQNGEMPCKRLFLDYHGLRFLHEWMVEIREMDDEIDIDIFYLKMAFLNTLDSLPVCNKTVLKESGIWEVVQNWSELKHSDRSMTTDDDSNGSEPTEKDVFTKVNKLMEKWKDLPEVFKIPKRERIEQMKEHEREADRAFKTLNIQDEFSHQNHSRFKRIDFKTRSEQYSQRTNSMFSWSRTADARRKDTALEKSPNDNLSKEQRREMFALKVKRDENEKRLAEENRMIDVRCKVFGLDPKLIDRTLLPYRLDNKTMEWYSQTNRKIDVPPSYASCPPPKKTQSTNPQDYRLPKMNLPAEWRFALDGFGRCYYFNKRLRVSQWHQPITLKPSGGNSFIKLPVSTEKKDESDEEDAGSDLSGDETELWLASKNPNSLKDYITTKVEKRRIKRNNFLVKERAISPRKEEDRLHNQAEMRKYKETKEKLRRRKEEKKKRKFLSLDPSSSVSQLPIQDYLLSSDDEDLVNDLSDQQMSTACPLIDKIVEEDRLVDEVEFIERHKPLKRHLSGGSRDKYEHRDRKRQKMEGSYKRESSSSGRSSSSKYKSVEPLSKKTKERFRSDIGLFIMQNLIHYRKPTCGSGRITSAEDFDHLTRKLTHYILTKESRHCGNNLEVTDSVKNKTREYIKKYMVKYGDVYTKPSGDPEFKEIPNIKSLLAILEEYERVENFNIYNS